MVKRDVLLPRATVNGRPACERCGIYADALEPSHRKPRSAFSVRNLAQHNPSNLLMLCATDHRWCHDHPEQAYIFGWFIRRDDPRDPSEVPVRYRGVRVYLDDEGNVSAA